MIFRSVAAHGEVGSRVATVRDQETLMMGCTPHRLVALVTLVLLVGATFCLFDGDHDARLDLCNLLLLPVAALALAAPSLLVGRMMPISIPLEPAAAGGPPFPPPRS